MSELIFVRHGQASFGKESYDKLSDKGIEQVQILARHWLKNQEEFDCIYCGSLLRQKETAMELLSLVKDNPEQPTENPSFNEYNADPLMRVYLRDYAALDGHDSNPRWPIKDERTFQKIFEDATAKWIGNELQPRVEDTDFEYWSDFQQRVYSVIDEVMEKHRGGSRVLISTSGGVIAMALQRVLQFPDRHVIATNWMVRNSSVTRVKYGKGKLSLTQFNNLAHLEQPGLQNMVTYR